MIRRKDAGTVGISHRAFRIEGYGLMEVEIEDERKHRQARNVLHLVGMNIGIPHYMAREIAKTLARHAEPHIASGHHRLESHIVELRRQTWSGRHDCTLDGRRHGEWIKYNAIYQREEQHSVPG